MRQQPTGRGDTLELNLAVRGGLEPRVREGGRAVTFVDAKGRALDARMEADCG